MIAEDPKIYDELVKVVHEIHQMKESDLRKMQQMHKLEPIKDSKGKQYFRAVRMDEITKFYGEFINRSVSCATNFDLRKMVQNPNGQ